MIPRRCYDSAVKFGLPPSTGEGGAQRRMRASFIQPNAYPLKGRDLGGYVKFMILACNPCKRITSESGERA